VEQEAYQPWEGGDTFADKIQGDRTRLEEDVFFIVAGEYCIRSLKLK
jgi:hypothetical protein